MPPGAAVVLGDYLDPENPVGRLVYRPAEGFDQAINESLPVAHSYFEELARRQAVGQSDASQGAAIEIGKQIERSDKTVYNKVREWREFVARWVRINRR
jgi:hypothetical protein